MRKAFVCFLALLLCCAALAEGVYGQDALVGKWEDVVSQRAWMRIDLSQDGGYDVCVYWGSGIYEGTEWLMTCVYDPESNTLAYSDGTCCDYTYDDSGAVVDVETYYEGAEGVLSIDRYGVIRIDTDDESLAGCRFVWSEE